MKTNNNFDDYLKLFREEFLPAYSDLVGYLSDKPQEILLEIENTFTHIMQYFNDEIDEAAREDNLAKARNHLIRSCLDCYKMIWTLMKEDLDKIGKDKYKRKFGVNMTEGEFLAKYTKFKSAAQEARRIEMENVGINPLASLERYKEAIEIGKELLGNIDHNKLEEFESFMWRAKTFVTAREFIVGLFSGLLAGLILHFIF
jgi:hypothetical protein